ncbi:serine/threonine kinase-like domain-containing protein STKLD1 [Hypomesus transpacificus]|uniref:serine/threonine kinase-like domain-containing protein STKLD1 n=1 Tax=Hypomesus transpacificus TaxID=137520 RepID=UPI001F082CAB|nr:serine/threonine kinase-like domain-containing protein STKLD1 [Hypomesus transpacificus]
MDEFMVQDAFSPGCFGTAVLVTDRISGVELTLKKVECLDEGRANQALDEARCMLNFKHPNIVRYRKLFITWDQTISSVFLSMVMNCPYRTTLEAIITTHRDNKKKIRRHVKHTRSRHCDAINLAYLHSFMCPVFLHCWTR